MLVTLETKRPQLALATTAWGGSLRIAECRRSIFVARTSHRRNHQDRQSARKYRPQGATTMTRRFAVLLLAALIGSAVSCSKDEVVFPTTPSFTPVPSTYEYRVTGTPLTSRVSLTYATVGGTSQVSSAVVPWTHTRSASAGDFLYVSAQIVEGTGSVTVAITHAGSVLRTTTSSGFASIATVSMSAP